MGRVLLKLSGEALGGAKSGIDPEILKSFAKQIYDAYKTKTNDIQVVVGGGNFFRGRHAKELGMDRVTMDYMGMTGTILNACYLREALNSLGAKAVVLSCLEMPQVLETYTKADAIKYLEEGNIVIYAGGTGKPYFSTDTASLNRAVDTSTDIVLMAKQGVDGVYDKDPNVFKDAKRFDSLTHEDVIEKRLEFMDLTAATIANDNDIDILVFDSNKKNAVYDSLTGNLNGTIIRKSNK